MKRGKAGRAAWLLAAAALTAAFPQQAMASGSDALKEEADRYGEELEAAREDLEALEKDLASAEYDAQSLETALTAVKAEEEEYVSSMGEGAWFYRALSEETELGFLFFPSFSSGLIDRCRYLKFSYEEDKEALNGYIAAAEELNAEKDGADAAVHELSGLVSSAERRERELSGAYGEAMAAYEARLAAEKKAAEEEAERKAEEEANAAAEKAAAKEGGSSGMSQAGQATSGTSASEGKLGTAGRLSIPSHGISVALYTASIYDSSNQKVVDAKDSAAYMEYEGGVIIADHVNQAFADLSKVSAGDTMHIDGGGSAGDWVCVRACAGKNLGYDMVDSSGNSIDGSLPGRLCLYTCRTGGITITLWERA